jgi:hypothetical protein
VSDFVRHEPVQAVVVDGQVVASTAEGRFKRIKHSSLPYQARYMRTLQQHDAGSLSQVSCIKNEIREGSRPTLETGPYGSTLRGNYDRKHLPFG